MKIDSCVTTCPRAEPYLEATLASLERAGFTPRIFVDDPPSGAYQAFLKALGAMLDTDADAVIVFQDDVEVSLGLHDWLVRNLFPEDPLSIGCLSLYTAASQDPGKPGWHQLPTVKRTGPDKKVRDRTIPFGALAFVFPMASAKRLCKFPPSRLARNGTCMQVGEFCDYAGLKFLHHSPSLCRHIGVVSAVNSVWDIHDHESNPHRNCADTWLREVPQEVLDFRV
jgi:hypothetical protein